MGLGISFVVAGFAGAFIMGTDTAKTTIAWSWQITGRRSTLCAIRLILICLGSLIATAASIATGALIYSVADPTFTWTIDDPSRTSLIATALVSIMWPLFTACFAVIFRSGTAAAVLFVVDSLFLESILLSSDRFHRFAANLPFMSCHIATGHMEIEWFAKDNLHDRGSISRRVDRCFNRLGVLAQPPPDSLTRQKKKSRPVLCIPDGILSLPSEAPCASKNILDLGANIEPVDT